MKRNPELKTPWTTAGLLHSPGKPEIEVSGRKVWPDVQEWRDNDPFTATLQLKGTERGRSAAFFIWQDVATGQFYPMFISDVGHMIMQGMRLEKGGQVRGRWFVVKRGQNYGIRPEDDPTDGQNGPTEALAGAAGG